MQTGLMLESFSKTVSVKGAIIEVLSKTWPLSVKQLHSIIVREQGRDVTYQAVHKALSQLLGEGLVLEDKRAFCLAVSKLRSWKEHIGRIEEIYSGKSLDLIASMQEGDTRTILFDRYTDFILFSGRTVDKQALLSQSSNKVFASLRHLYWPLEFKFEDYNLLLSILRHAEAFCCMAGSSSALDKWVKREYEMAGTKKHWTAIGVEREIEDDIWTYGDYVFSVKYSPQTRKTVDEFYSNNSGLKDLFLQYLRGKSNPVAGEITVQATRNKELASIIRAQIKSQLESISGVPV